MVVTRFAPSPTGYLHVGGARTALFNWLWARRNRGRFILRIEDTDRKRNTPTAAKQVMDDLRWLGIDWDEGPGVGGPSGPYLQSERRDIYDRYVRQLLDEQKAYYCFDTADELDALRKQAQAGKGGFAYRRPERFPQAGDAEKARAEGRPVTVRFAVPQDEPIVVNDVVRGRVSFAAGEVGDFIILKSDGFPTYNFACVVDDYMMKITHVIRGQEHLMNTPGQQALWRALFGDAPPPKYAHMSVTVSDSGGKLSKRERPKALRETMRPRANKEFIDAVAANSAVDTWPALTSLQVKEFVGGQSVPDMPYIDRMADFVGVALPEINIVDFSKSGYLPETMVNFLALLGWSPGDGREIMPLGELIDSFDLARLTKSNSLFDRHKLLAFNTEHIKMTGPETLLEHLKAYLKNAGSPLLAADDPLLLRVITTCEGARTLADIDRKSRFIFIDDDKIEYDVKAVNKVLLKGDGLAMLAVVRDRLAAMEHFSQEAIEDMLRSLAEEKQVGLGKVAQPLRVAICGTTISLPIFDSVQILGREGTLTRIDNTLKKFEGTAKS
ncbi:MAG: glutamate--tRNA ligase [Phycisphaerales bacterium]|nr:MAG: glutamate--tRNA ligase [Phycisphaerales bacterium]